MRFKIHGQGFLAVITPGQRKYRSVIQISDNESRILRRKFDEWDQAINYGLRFIRTWDRIYPEQFQLSIDDGDHDHGADQLQVRSKKGARFSR